MQAIEVKNLSFTYSKKTPYEKQALKNVNIAIAEGEFLGIIGHTGSGKSTFIQHLNGLIRTQEGTVRIFDADISVKKPKPDLRKLRGDVGMVFQYPEYQLFDDTVAKDVGFGCRNMKLDKSEIETRVKEALTLVGLSYDKIKDRSPFDLSGGQKRRVAIAGVIAMNPKILILDEPTAGLDPAGKAQILDLITSLKKARGLTVIIISHDIDEIVRYADRIVVFNDAQIAYDVPMTELFENPNKLTEIGLDIPLAVKLKNNLATNGINLNYDIVNDEDFIEAVARYCSLPAVGKADNGAVLNVKDAENKTDNNYKLIKEALETDFFGGDE